MSLRAVLLVIAFATLVWGRGLGGGYRGDDFGFVGFGNALARVPFLDSLRFFWIELPPEMGLRFYRPLTGWSFSVEARLFDLEPWPRQLVNLGLHCGSALLIGALAFALSRSRRAALVAAMFFAIFPGHPESLLWIASRVNLLATFFALLAVVAFSRRHARHGGPAWTALGVIAALLAALSKETGAIAPFAIGIVYACGWLGGPGAGTAPVERLRRTTIALWPYLLGFGVYLALRHHALGEFVGGGYLQRPDLTSSDFWLGRAGVLFALLAPVHLAEWPLAVKLLLACLVLGILGSGAAQAPARGILASLGVLLLALLPGFAAPFTPATLQDSRLLYEPAAVSAIVVAVSLARIEPSRPVAMRVLGAVLLLAFFVIAWGNAAPWLRAGRISATVQSQLAAWQNEDFAGPRWVVDLPVQVDGAYVFLGDGEPFLDPRLEPTKTARLVGVRDRDFERVLREADRRREDPDGWDVWRVNWMNGELTRERPSTWLPAGDSGLRVVRSARRQVRPGDAVPIEFLVDSAVATITGPRLELTADGARIECATIAESDGLARVARCLVPANTPFGRYATRLVFDGDITLAGDDIEIAPDPW